MKNMTSAIFNKSSTYILATTYELKHHIQFFDPTDFKAMGTLNFSLGATDSLFDVYRLFQLCDYVDDHLIIGGAGFENQTCVDDNIGSQATFWIGEDLKPGMTLDQIKANGNFKFFVDYAS